MGYRDSIDVPAGDVYFKFCKKGGRVAGFYVCTCPPLRFLAGILEHSPSAEYSSLPPTAFAIRPPHKPTGHKSLEKFWYLNKNLPSSPSA